MRIPTLTTDRLILRPFRLEDIPAVEHLLSTPHVSEHTLSFPWPYPPGAARRWITLHAEWAEVGMHVQWAVAVSDDTLVGAIGIAIRDGPPHGEIGYWIGPDFWNRGYATEATRAVIGWGMETLHLPRIQAACFVENNASARVLIKAGMVEEDIRREHVVKDGVPRDVRMFAVTRDPVPSTSHSLA